jgi:hypothetical protein
LRQKVKKTCPSSVRFPLQAVRPYLFKPIVEQFCHLAFPALSSGLDSVPRGKTDQSQSGKKVETFTGRDGSAKKEVRCDWCNPCNDLNSHSASSHWQRLLTDA